MFTQCPWYSYLIKYYVSCCKFWDVQNAEKLVLGSPYIVLELLVCVKMKMDLCQCSPSHLFHFKYQQQILKYSAIANPSYSENLDYWMRYLSIQTLCPYIVNVFLTVILVLMTLVCSRIHQIGLNASYSYAKST